MFSIRRDRFETCLYKAGQISQQIILKLLSRKSSNAINIRIFKRRHRADLAAGAAQTASGEIHLKHCRIFSLIPFPFLTLHRNALRRAQAHARAASDACGPPCFIIHYQLRMAPVAFPHGEFFTRVLNRYYRRQQRLERHDKSRNKTFCTNEQIATVRVHSSFTSMVVKRRFTSDSGIRYFQAKFIS